MHYFLTTVIGGLCHLSTLARARCVVSDTRSAQCFSLLEVAMLIPLAKSISNLEVSCSKTNEAIPMRVFTAFSNLEKFELHGCDDAFGDLLEVLTQLRSLNATGNAIQVAPWQRFQHVVSNVLDLRKNPLSCDCLNNWIWDYQQRDKQAHGWDPHFVVKLPLIIYTDPIFEDCNFQKCPTESITAISDVSLSSLTMGGPLNLRCHVDSPLLQYANFNMSTHPAFIWPYNTNSHQTNPTRREAWNPETHDVTLELSSLTSTELGYAACICQRCNRPVFDNFKLKFYTFLSVALKEDDRDTYVIIHGYPLYALRLSVVRLVDNVTEDADLNDADINLFNSTLEIRSQTGFGQPDFLRYYVLIVRECSRCQKRFSHIDSEYVITVCRGNDTACVVAVGELVNAHDSQKTLNNRNLPTNQNSTTFFILILNLGIAIVILLILFFRVHIKHKLLKKGWEIRRRRISRNTGRTEESSIRLEDYYTVSSSLNSTVQHTPIIELDTLKIKERIGKGAFGEVYAAEWYQKDEMTSPTKVAVKKLFNVQFDSELDKEAALQALLNHPNIVKMFGIARSEGQISLIMELMNLGDLKTFVQNRAPRSNDYSQFPPALIPSELLNIAGQVAAGLAYLGSQNIVHRDLASRNCLVQGESDLKFSNAVFRKSITVKISDFGMSRRLFSNSEYYKMHNSTTVLPVRWLPLECLSLGKFTHQSDMWSFGMVLYEIFSYGAMPYGDLSNSEVVSAVMSGTKPELPSTFPEPINALIKACWRTDHELRITASEALNRLAIIA